jgi:hypothetical protein
VDRERDAVLTAARWCVLAWEEVGAPAAAPSLCWSDGAGLWLAVPAGAADAAAGKPWAAWIPPLEDGGPGVAVAGSGRLFGAGDPVGLLLHGAPLSTAAVLLATRNRAMALQLPRTRLGRLTIHRLRGELPPPPGPGMGPALPAAVPAGLRRLLAGTRSVLVVTGTGDRGEGVALTPATWSAGFHLDTAEPVPSGTATVVVISATSAQPLPAAHLALTGDVTDGRLAPRRATWWTGAQSASDEVAAVSPTLELPE